MYPGSWNFLTVRTVWVHSICMPGTCCCLLSFARPFCISESTACCPSSRLHDLLVCPLQDAQTDEQVEGSQLSCCCRLSLHCCCRLSLKDVKLYGTVRINLLGQAEGVSITKAQIQAALSQSSLATQPSASRPRTMPHSPTRIVPPVTYSLYHNQY